MYKNILTELEYLVNPLLYNKIFNKEVDEISKKDIKFYRKRIIQLTKNLFKDNDYPPSLINAHTEYVHTAINYLKVEDTRDILQEEYDNIESDEMGSLDADKLLYNDNPDKILYNTKDKDMRDFVTIKKKENKKNLPLVKNIELNDPKLKMKGVKKKKISSKTNENKKKIQLS